MIMVLQGCTYYKVCYLPLLELAVPETSEFCLENKLETISSQSSGYLHDMYICASVETDLNCPMHCVKYTVAQHT